MSASNRPNDDNDTLEPDPSNFSDQDSTFDERRSSQSSTTSLRSSIHNFLREENGRIYPRDGQYYFPIDKEEQERLLHEHRLFLTLLDGNLFMAPISQVPQHVLDIGTGYGKWAMDFADEYPSAHVIGTDLSPIQAEWLPPNCDWQIADANRDLTFSKKFEFIHCRQLHMAVPEQKLFRQSYEALQGKGWLEVVEIALPLRCVDTSLQGTSLLQWDEEMMEASKLINTPFDKPRSYRQWMIEAGFVNVQEFVDPIPLGTWPKHPKLKKLGWLQKHNLLLGLRGFSLALLRNHRNWSREGLEVFLADVRKDIDDPTVHSYYEVVRVIGQKPAEVRSQ